jgi:hypothetical protein
MGWGRKPKTSKASSSTSVEEPKSDPIDTTKPTETVTAPPAQLAPENEGENQKLEREKTKDEEDDIVYPTGAKLALILFALCLSVFLVALDQTIIATAIPKM